MNERLTEHPVAVAAAIVLAVLASWFFDSYFWILAAAAIGAVGGLAVEKTTKQ
jgi:hypothetical protein